MNVGRSTFEASLLPGSGGEGGDGAPVTAANLGALATAMASSPDGAVGIPADSLLHFSWDGVATLSSIEGLPIKAANLTALENLFTALQDGGVDPENLIAYDLATESYYRRNGAAAFDSLSIIASTNILPARAWVDFMAQAYDSGFSIGRDVDLSTNGVSEFGSAALDAWLTAVTVSTSAMTFNLNGGSLSTANVDALLSSLQAILALDSSIIDLAGGTMGVPTGGALNADYVALVGAGHTVNITT